MWGVDVVHMDPEELTLDHQTETHRAEEHCLMLIHWFGTFPQSVQTMIPDGPATKLWYPDGSPVPASHGYGTDQEVALMPE